MLVVFHPLDIVRKELAGAREKRPFTNRAELLDVKGLGPKAFEQCAGFLRLRSGGHPLDASAVHPERYELVARIATDLGVPVGSLVGNKEMVRRIDLPRCVGEDIGLPTLEDIARELKKPGRDPRDVFVAPMFRRLVMGM